MFWRRVWKGNEGRRLHLERPHFSFGRPPQQSSSKFRAAMCKVEKPGLPMAPIDDSVTQPKFVKAFEPQHEFHWVPTDEPHATRRKLILAKHPEVTKLMGHCWKTKYIVAAVVAFQSVLAIQAQHWSWPVYLAVMYVVGGTANHAMMMGMHEISHNLGFKKPTHNKLLAILANLPIGVPSAISFKRYHAEHHKYQGEEGIDADLPTEWEGRIFSNKFTKLLFLVFQVFFYAFRPLVVNPKKPGLWELYNWIICAAYDFAIYYYGGRAGLAYLLVGTFLGAGVHPVAGHFIAEHYEFILGYETYSYYGVLNWVTFNVGLHNEHHDFPFIPGSRLHQLHDLAPEFYDNLPSHKSWVKVLYDYVMDPNINAYSRVKRRTLEDDDLKKLKSS